MPNAEVGEAGSQVDAADALLVARVRAGEAAAENELVRRFTRPILAVAQNRLGHAENARDVAQETFIVVLDRLRTEGLDDPTRLAGFVRQTAINLATGVLRKQQRQRTASASDVIDSVIDDCAGPFAKLEQEELAGIVRSLVGELGVERDRQLLWKHYVLDQDKHTLCEEFALSEEHFDRVVHRARHRLRMLAQARQATLR